MGIPTYPFLITVAAMEAGLATGYAVETAAEGVIGAGVAIAKSTMPLRASWKRISTGTPLARSSHSLSIVRGVAYVFGGVAVKRCNR